jgi:hypothetical protein
MLKTGRTADHRLSLRQEAEMSFLMSVVDAGPVPVLSEAAESNMWDVGWAGSIRAQTGDSTTRCLG